MAPLNQLTSSRPQPVLRGKRSLQGSIQRLAQQPCECQWCAALSMPFLVNCSFLGHRTLATYLNDTKIFEYVFHDVHELRRLELGESEELEDNT